MNRDPRVIVGAVVRAARTIRKETGHSLAQMQIEVTDGVLHDAIFELSTSPATSTYVRSGDRVTIAGLPVFIIDSDTPVARVATAQSSGERTYRRDSGVAETVTITLSVNLTEWLS